MKKETIHNKLLDVQYAVHHLYYKIAQAENKGKYKNYNASEMRFKLDDINQDIINALEELDFHNERKVKKTT